MPDLIQSATRARRLCLYAVVSTIAAGCGFAGPAGTAWADPKALPPVAAAGFRLQGVEVQWQPNPAFRVGYTYVVPQHMQNAPPPVPEPIKKRVDEQVATILKLFNEEAVPQLTDALLAQQVPLGASHRIVLTPMSAFQSSSGWGTSITVRATIFDRDNRALWHSDIESHSGLQWLGPAFSKPDDSYVRNYTKGLIDNMRKAGLVGVS